MQFLPRIKQATDAVLNITTGGGLNMTVEQRLAAPLQAKPEMCSLNMGSMNFGIFPLADRYKKWKFDWEEPYLRGTDDFIFRNTFRDIERILKILGEDHGTRFEHECYDVGHLYILDHHPKNKKIKGPLIVQFLTGILGGIPSDIDHLLHMKRTAERLFGNDVILFTHGTGPDNMRAAPMEASWGPIFVSGRRATCWNGRGNSSSRMPSRLKRSSASWMNSTLPS